MQDARLVCTFGLHIQRAGSTRAIERRLAAVGQRPRAHRRVRFSIRFHPSAHCGRVLLRPSGTEPVVRVMVEGEDAELVRRLAEELAGVVAAQAL